MTINDGRDNAAACEYALSGVASNAPTVMASPSMTVPTAVRDIVCQGARVRVREVGTGRPLLLLHDFLSDHREWRAVEEAFARRFRVLCLDLPGFGESEKPAAAHFRYGFERFAQVLVDIAGALDAAPLSVCGHGLGAAVAIALAERHPAMVERVVLVSPPLFGSRPVALGPVFAWPVLGQVAFKQLVGKRMFAWHFERGVFAATAPSPARVEELFRTFNSPAARDAARAVLEALFDTRTLEAGLARVRAPTLVVWGRRDALVPVGHARRLVRDLPSGRLELFDCGHAPAEELPGRFATVCLDFLGAT